MKTYTVKQDIPVWDRTIYRVVVPDDIPESEIENFIHEAIIEDDECVVEIGRECLGNFTGRDPDYIIEKD